jgi:predicted porin
MEIFMNNKIKLAVAGAVLSAASAANAGIVIPAGDWTLDVNGNVNAFATWSRFDDKSAGACGATAGCLAGAEQEYENGREDNTQSINTGLLPAWLGFTGTTRQNDLDVSFTISMQPNVSENSFLGDNGSSSTYSTTLFRQAFITFGDKSWGTVKLGKDLGVFAGQAILHDMTLLGVGGGAGNSGASTTLGGIGSGYIYPAWKGQISYTTPNMNGFQATIAMTNPNQGLVGAQNQSTWTTNVTTNHNSQLYQDRFGFEGQVSYEWTGDVAGKVWVSGETYDVTADQSSHHENITTDSYTASAWDIGAAITTGNLGLTAYWYEGKGVGTTFTHNLGAWQTGSTNGKFKKRDSDGGYLQATYVIPTGTKLGVAYGISRLDEASGETADENLVKENKRWTVGAYHPLTKHLNLVAEYNAVESSAQGNAEIESSALSLGAILFF